MKSIWNFVANGCCCAMIPLTPRYSGWYEGKRYADATVVDLSRPYDRRVKPEPAAPLGIEPDGQVAFLELAEQRRQAQWVTEPVSYAKAKGGEA